MAKRCVVSILLVFISFIIVGSVFWKNTKKNEDKNNAISGDAGDHHVDLIGTVKNIDTQNRMLDVDSDGVEYSVKYENTLDNKIPRLNIGSKVHFSYWSYNMDGNSVKIEDFFVEPPNYDASTRLVCLTGIVEEKDSTNRILTVNSDGDIYLLKYYEDLAYQVKNKLEIGTKGYFYYWPSNMEGNSIDIESFFKD